MKRTPKPKRPPSPDRDRVFPISGVPLMGGDISVPSDTEMELYRIRRELDFLRGEIQKLKASIRYKDERLREQVDLWRLGLDYGEWPTMGAGAAEPGGGSRAVSCGLASGVPAEEGVGPKRGTQPQGQRHTQRA